MSVIEVKNLTKDYGSGRGVFDVSLAVEKGEVFGFLGPNGAGKSTTIRHLMGFSKPDSGETLIFGKPTFERYNEILSRSDIFRARLRCRKDLPVGSLSE